MNNDGVVCRGITATSKATDVAIEKKQEWGKSNTDTDHRWSWVSSWNLKVGILKD